MIAKKIKNKVTKKSQLKKLLQLLDAWTEAEIVARYFPFNNNYLTYLEFANDHIKAADEIRKLLYGSDNLVHIGEQYGILETAAMKRKRKARHGKSKKNQKRLY